MTSLRIASLLISQVLKDISVSTYDADSIIGPAVIATEFSDRLIQVR